MAGVAWGSGQSLRAISLEVVGPEFIGLSQGVDLNDAGQVAGVNVINVRIGFVDGPSGLVDLNDVFGGLSAELVGINTPGGATGYLFSPRFNIFRGFRLDGATVTSVFDHNGRNTFTAAINDAGVVVGESQDQSGRSEAIRVIGNSVEGLGFLPPMDTGAPLGSSAKDINNSGVIVGFSSFEMPGGGATDHAFRHEGGVMVDLHPRLLGLVEGAVPFRSSAEAINESGQIAGSFFTGQGNPQVFLIDGESVISLGQASLGGLNDAGTVVGTRLGVPGVEAGREPSFIFRDGEFTDLALLAGPLLSDGTSEGFTRLFPSAINNRNQITGSGIYRFADGFEATRAFRLTLAFDQEDDRLHWISADSTIRPGDASQWAENLPITAGRFASFDVRRRDLALTLGEGSEWRGLIVDGETVDLNLNLANLQLSGEGDAPEFPNILLGERCPSPSDLTLRDGTVGFRVGIVVGGGASPASLTLDDNLRALGSADLATRTVVGRGGDGRLVIRNASRLATGVFELAEQSGRTGSAEVDGAGSRLDAATLIVGRRGAGSLVVRNGATLVSQALTLGQQGASRGTLRLEGDETRYLLGQQVFGGQAVSKVALGGAGVLELSGGARILGQSTPIEIGTGLAGVEARCTVRGLGSGLDSALLAVEEFGRFEVREDASASDLGLSVFAGGVAEFDDAAIDGVTFIVGGRLAIANGSDVRVADRITVQAGGLLQASGAGTMLRDFQFFTVQGRLDVSDGAIVKAGSNDFGPAEIALSGDGVLTGDGGTIVGNVFVPSGRIAQGNSPGVLTIEGDLTLSGTGSVQFEVGGTTPGVEYDQLVVTDDARFDGGVIELAFIGGFEPMPGQVFDFLDVGGNFESNASFKVTGLEPGWEFAAEFDAGAGRLRVTSLNRGTAAAAGLRFEIASIVAATPDAPARFSGSIRGAANSEIIVEASTDLGRTDAWVEIGRIVLDGGGIGVITDLADPGSTGSGHGFLRIRPVP